MSPYTLVELVRAGVEDYSPILDDIINNTLWDGKILDQGLHPPHRWGQVALLDELNELLSQDCLLVWFERRLSLSCRGPLARIEHVDTPFGLDAVARRESEENKP